MEQGKRMTDEITQTLLKQLAKQQAELEKLEKENEKLRNNSNITQKTKDSEIYCVTRKSGKKVYGFYIYDENFKKIKRERYNSITEAKNAKREMLNLRDKNKLATQNANRKQTFEYFCKKYIKNAEANFVLNTIDANKGIIKNHLSYFKDIPVIKITDDLARTWANSKRVEMKSTPSAFNNSLKVAKAIWNYARFIKITKLENPFTGINDIDIEHECETRESVRIDKEQKDLILDTARQMYSDYTHAVIATAIYSGMREGEILGLEWRRIDLKNKTIDIRQQTKKVTKKYIKEQQKINPNITEKELMLTTQLKTKGSKGKIPIPDILADVLREYKKELMTKDNLHDLCFCKKDGMPLVARDFVRYRYQNVIEKTFGDKTFLLFHELRGSFATILHLEGVPSKIIQILLRHNKQQTTEDIYNKVSLQNKIVTENLNKVFTA